MNNLPTIMKCISVRRNVVVKTDTCHFDDEQINVGMWFESGGITTYLHLSSEDARAIAAALVECAEHYELVRTAARFDAEVAA